MRLTSRRIVTFLPLLSVALLAAAILTQRPGPVSANPLTGIASISAGEIRTCAVTTAGDVTCWGAGGGRQQIAGLSSVQVVSVGDQHACAVISTGGVKCWGLNNVGQVGNGTTSFDVYPPVDVLSLSSTTDISAFVYYTCAVNSGALWCWGSGFFPEAPGPTPAVVGGLSSGVATVASGANHACVLTTAGGVRCLGLNSFGQLGNGTTIDSAVPVDVTGLTSGATAVGAGIDFSCALTTGGTVECWGAGYGTTPVAISGLSGATALSVGGLHACALTTLGGVKCWGNNSSGELGDGQQCGLYCSAAVDVAGLGSGVAAADSGIYHTCALKATGQVVCWGDNTTGELGDGTFVNRTRPVTVVDEFAKPTATFTPCPGVCPTSTATNTPSPLTAPDFSIGIGAQCDSSAGMNKCFAGAGSTFTVEFRLRGLPSGLAYAGYDAAITYSSGLTTNAGSLVKLGATAWPSCAFPASNFYPPGTVIFGCAIGVNAPLSQYTGALARLDFQCPSTPSVETITLVHGHHSTDLIDAAIDEHVEVPSGSESLMINCVSVPPTATPTATPTPLPQPRIAKLPPLQNVFLHKQGAKLPPQRCEDSTDAAILEETIMSPIVSQDPKGVTGLQQLAAFEFEVRFDAKLVCVSIIPGPDWQAVGAICAALPAKGLIRYGCVTVGKGHGLNSAVIDQPMAILFVRPQPELYSQLRPNQDNGIPVQILNQGCQLADEQGHPIAISSCEDADITFRYLEGDVTADCLVDVLDAQQVAFRWAATLGSLLYTPFMDLVPSGQVKGDGQINITDLQFVFGRMGSTCASPWPPQLPVNPKA